MYKYYEKNGYNVMYHYFDSITEFLEHIETAKLSDAFSGRKLLSESTDNYEWYKTQNLAQAKEMAKYGYHENFQKFLELKLKLEKYIKLNRKKINNIIFILDMYQM